jgi:hypothetical protein
LEIGQGGHSGNGRGEMQAGVSRRRLDRIRVRIRIRDEQPRQSLGGEHVPGCPGRGEGGAASENDSVSHPSRGMSLLKSIGEDIKGADLLEVEGTLASGAGDSEGSGGAGTAAFERG